MPSTAPINPGRVGDSVFMLKIISDGNALPDEYQIESITTNAALNQVPTAQLTLFDGSAAQEDFEMSSGKLLIPGRNVVISLGYHGRGTPVFAGVIVGQRITIDPEQGSRLVIDLVDESIKMTLAPKTATFTNMKDSDIISSLISESGLAGSVTATAAAHEQIVQHNATDWDMMLARARLNGLVVTVDGGEVTVEQPDTGQKPALAVTYGESILAFDGEMDAATQLAQSAIASTAWDVAEQQSISVSPGARKVTEPGNLSSAELAKVFDTSLAQQSGAPVASETLAAWSTSTLQQSKLAKIRGRVSFQGSALAKIGTTIKLAGLGKRFDGNAYISGVNHSVKAGKWHTTCEFGMAPDWFDEDRAPATNLPPISGLHTGIVSQLGDDPTGEFRVQVELPLAGGKTAVWTRLASFYASTNVGAVFYPELGDEVIVGFMDNNPSYGVILGSVFSPKHVPPYEPDNDNNIKALVTRSKLEMVFDDEDKIIEIKTPGGHSVKLDDDDGSITIVDSNSNSVAMSSSGITITSAGDIEITAAGDISLDAGADIDLKANAQLTAEGAAGAELSASGVVRVQGALVQIN